MNQKSIYERNLRNSRQDLSISSFSYLLSEICQRFLAANKDCNLDLELSKVGEKIGGKYLDLVVFREKLYKREIKHVEMLKFVQGILWKNLFGKAADSLEKIIDSDTSYKLIDKCMSYLQYSSPHPNFHIGSFVAGIIQGVLKVSSFPCEVTVMEGNSECEVFFFIEFTRDVLARESK